MLLTLRTTYFCASRFDPKVAVYYCAAMSLQWYVLRFVRAALKSKARVALSSPAIPLAQIAWSIDDGADGSCVSLAFEDLTTELPARNHFALASRPFVKDGPCVALPFLNGNLGTWNVTVRKAYQGWRWADCNLGGFLRGLFASD